MIHKYVQPRCKSCRLRLPLLNLAQPTLIAVVVPLIRPAAFVLAALVLAARAFAALAARVLAALAALILALKRCR